MSILDILVDKKIVTPENIVSIKEEAVSKNISIEEVLKKRGVADKEIISAKAEYLNIPLRVIGKENISSDILDYIPEESAGHYKFVPIGVKDSVLEVGITDPDNIEAKDALNFISSKIGMPFKLFLISEGDFKRVLEMYGGISNEVTAALSEFDTDITVETPTSADDGGVSGEETKKEIGADGKTDAKIIEAAPITKIVATILRYAAEGSASDVHIEPTKESVRVRFRVDGILTTSLILPVKVHSALIARIKILSNMRLDEKRKPQDGRFSGKIEGRRIDFRVSTFPTYYGEKIVMRILDQEKGVKKLTDIGMSKKNLDTILASIKRPYGLILISGPTGSGKSTTLYAMLNEVDKERLNVLSLEDPIEYSMDGMSQSQVRPDIGYSFASGLRTTLRQDPDVIMVGEIRDKETAQLAIQAALTGHLVFSTIHTNDAIGVIPRLIDMGVDPYLIGPTLIMAMAQRLVGNLYEHKGSSVPVDGAIRMMFEKQFSDLPEKYRKEIVFSNEVFEAKGTPECPTGTKGRSAVTEVLLMDKDFEALILKNPTDIEIRKLARSKGMLTMKEDAIIKAMNKEIPFSSVGEL